jgi:hypothetical protein
MDWRVLRPLARVKRLTQAGGDLGKIYRAYCGENGANLRKACRFGLNLVHGFHGPRRRSIGSVDKTGSETSVSRLRRPRP